MKYRDVKDDCMNCSSQVPPASDRVNDDGYIRYYCSKCSHTIVEGIIAEDGSPAPTFMDPPPGCSMSLPTEVNWTTWETWWTDRMCVTLLNGRYVDGNENLIDFLEQLRFYHE